MQMRIELVLVMNIIFFFVFHFCCASSWRLVVDVGMAHFLSTKCVNLNVAICMNHYSEVVDVNQRNITSASAECGLKI